MLTTLQRWGVGLRRSLFQGGQLAMVVVAVVIGLLAGFGAVGFRSLIERLQGAAWGAEQPSLQYLSGLPFWWKIVAPAAGGLVVGWITYRFAREARGHGVPEVMEAVALRGGRIRPRVVVAKMFASAISIASGGSVGREGPIVQIGAAIGSSVGQWIRFDPRRLRTLVACGAAAGIAGTFNAPIAGALFAVEVILSDFGVAQFSPIVISSVAATVVSHHFLGDFPAFVVPGHSLVHPMELFAYVALGILAGFVALAFVKVLYRTEDLFDAIPLNPPVKGLLGGTAIGIIGIWLPHIFGVGYEAINDALNGSLVWWFMLLLAVVKIVAVSITIGSGGSGGIFAPSLFIGAMLGGGVGTVAHSLWPDSTAPSGAYALVGMGAVVAAATHAPITAILIIFELTNDYDIILPLMITCIIATLIATRLQSASIYTLKLLRRGVDIYRGRDINVLQALSVRELLRTDVVRVSPRDGIVHLIDRFMDHSGSTLFVTDAHDTLIGIITAETLRPFMKNSESMEGLIIAQDVMVTGTLPTVSVEQSLADAMRHLGGYRGEVPVLEDGRLIGVIWPEAIIERYNTEIFKQDMARSMASAIERQQRAERVPTFQDAAIAEIPVPLRFRGKTIQELDIRRQFGVTVLMIKQDVDGGSDRVDTDPTADYVFREGDSMLVMGPGEKVDKLRR